MQITIALQTDKRLEAYGLLAAQIEAYGFDGVTVYNDMLYQPAWPALFEMARQTEHVRLGPAAVNPFTSHPITIAGQAALLAEAAPGRTYLGLARGAWLEFVGIRPNRPVAALIEALRCIRHLLRGEPHPLGGNHCPRAGGDQPVVSAGRTRAARQGDDAGHKAQGTLSPGDDALARGTP